MTRGMGARVGGVAWGSCWKEAGAREMVELLQRKGNRWKRKGDVKDT